MPRAKKVVNIKNAFLHTRQLREGIFDICSNRCCIFTIEVFFQNGRHCFVFGKKISNSKFISFLIYIFRKSLIARHWSLRSGPYLLHISKRQEFLRLRQSEVDRRPKPTAVVEGFAPTATATAAEGFWPNFGRGSEKQVLLSSLH